MFEIKFVEHENPFYQVGKLFVFKLQCELFEYSGEDFDVGGAVDLIETENAYTIDMILQADGSGNYTRGESVTLGGAVVGEVVGWVPTTRELNIKDNTTAISVGDTLIGVDSEAEYIVYSIEDVLNFSHDKSAQNKDFETKADGYLDFSETNPFGEVT
jgi:hypothetical protein